MIYVKIKKIKKFLKIKEMMMQKDKRLYHLNIDCTEITKLLIPQFTL